jgi:hypothetical protein
LQELQLNFLFYDTPDALKEKINTSGSQAMAFIAKDEK